MRMRRRDPLLEEFIAAACAMGLFCGTITLAYWLATHRSPWPGLALGMIAGFGYGTALLALTSPRHRR